MHIIGLGNPGTQYSNTKHNVGYWVVDQLAHMFDMSFKLGKGSLAKLEGVDERMVAIVKYAIGVSKQDFSCIYGLRTIEEQRALVAKGASKTMKSNTSKNFSYDISISI